MASLTYNSVAVMRDAAHGTVCAVLQASPAPRLLPTICQEGKSSRHAILRERCLSYLAIALRGWAKAAFGKGDVLDSVT